MNDFNFDKDFLDDVIDKSLLNGGEYADLFFENTKVNSIIFQDEKVDSINSGVIYGVGLRVIANKKTIYLYSNNTSRDNLLLLAKNASEIVDGSRNNDKPVRESYGNVENKHPVHIEPFSISFDDKIEMLEFLDKKMRAVSDKIKQVTNRYLEKERNILVASSKGVFANDSQTYVRLTVSSLARDDSGSQSASKSYGALDGYKFIKDIDLDEMATETSETSIRMLSAGYPKSGVYPVVIDNAFGGVIFHEACGHALEATSVADDASVFCGKFEKPIASKIVTAIDDGTIKNAWGSYNIDDEGNKAQKTTLIKDGILKSYLVDELGSMKMEHDITGSARRENYQYPPTSRMRNTFIDKGTTKFEELFAGIEYGLYAKKMGGGSVDPSTTEYNFAVSEGYIIENGKITKPVRGATLIDKGCDTLMKIEGVSDNLELADGMCGSISGSVPTTVGQPAIRVSSLTVGGR